MIEYRSLRRRILQALLFFRRGLFAFLPFGIAMGIALGAVALRWSIIDAKWSFSVGLPAPVTFYALTEMTYDDPEATRKLQEQVRQSIIGASVQGRMNTEEGFQSEYQTLLNNPSSDTFLSPELRSVIDGLTLDKRENLLAVVRSIRDDINRNQFLTPERKDELIWQRMEILEPDPALANLAFQLLLELTENDAMASQAMTDRLRDLAASSVPTVHRKIFPGDTIVLQGEVVTKQIAALLKAQGYPEGTLPWGSIVMAMVASFLATLWIGRIADLSVIHHGADSTQGSWAFMLSLMAITWFTEIFGLQFGIVSLGVLPMIAFVFLTEPDLVAIHLALSISISGAVITSGTASSSFVMSVISGAFASLFSLNLFKGRFSRLLLFLRLTALGVSIVVMNSFLAVGLSSQMDVKTFGVSLIAVFLLSTATVVTLPVVEAVFDVLSPLRLMELTHPSHPLLRRLQMEAPGTYHHTQMVGNIAEAAAERIGLNPLLLRAGASFHDIGKLRRPQYFIENQLSGVNAHDTLTPTMSALIILSHVKDGLEMAEEYHLPMRLRDFIPEHHGTTCLTYFYKKALKDGENPQIDQFCYPGPKPQTRETALLMLADSVEASARGASRSIQRLSDLQSLIESVVASKIDAGQLDNVPFTLKELTEVKESMLETLRSMYHTRDIKPIEPDRGKKGSPTEKAEKAEKAEKTPSAGQAAEPPKEKGPNS